MRLESPTSVEPAAAAPDPPPRRRARRWLLAAAAVVALGVVGYAVWTASQVWLAWRGVEKVDFDLDDTRTALATAPTSEPDPAETGDLPVVDIPDPTPTIGDADVDVYLVVGLDDKPDAKSVRADAILLYVRPAGRSDPALLSFPRDMIIDSPCGGGVARISTLMEGCGDLANGPELLSLAVEDFTGLTVDHFAIIGFEGFIKAIDVLGGIEVCTPSALRNDGVELLPEGCTVLDGQRSLWWLQARTLEEYVDGEWRALEGDGDRLRNQRQQEFLLALADQLSGFRSVTDVAHLIDRLGDAVILDDSLTLTRAARLAWNARGLSGAGFHRPELALRAEATPDGQFVWVPEGDFADVLGEVYPSLF